WPTICLEVGYTEVYDKLLRDADILLEGSAGDIGQVLLIKLEPLLPDATEITHGLVEVWKFDVSAGTKKIVGGRRTLFPRPPNAASQRLVFSWRDLLADKMQACLVGPARSPPTLKLDLLRAQIEKATVWYLERSS
ncbi:hypothetical protein V8E54_013600, partial [Elaphomyces granulatus]